MAHRKNPRFLRSFFWSPSSISMYRRSKNMQPIWRNRIRIKKRSSSFFTQIFINEKKIFFAGQKKNNPLLKHTQRGFFSSHYKKKIYPLLSNAVSSSLRQRLKKFPKK